MKKLNINLGFNYKQFKEDFNNIKYGIIPFVIYCIIMQLVFGSICPFDGIFHIKCPGCGLTHATIYLFLGRFKDSFDANPTCIFWLLLFLLTFINRYIYTLKIKPFPIMFIFVSILTIIVYIVRVFNLFAF